MSNVGNLDRALRLIVGVLLLAAAFVPPMSDWVAGWGGWKYGLTAWGAIMIGTAVFRFCPAYALLGIRTCPVRLR